GGLGLVLTTLIITAPPMAASFFQGTLGQFTAYSALGQLDRASQDGSGGRPYQPATLASDSGSTAANYQKTILDTSVRSDASPQDSGAGSRGLAQK
ncbi:hypothetical protein VB151_18995, partial [Xanthomonas fragariae]|nr:hypothetical protein [Xanthomonas fragariae]MEA5200146.1 hypothetical protein [Xanthomonas fragariae]MEA5212407.1 hypothetical protein [Xanthomonas fragariae]MEA5220879.1 hypothetical protein [Xanthomonas fragariae]MEA5234274.1 hypothetical protein [Xanthomonas fragariae]